MKHIVAIAVLSLIAWATPVYAQDYLAPYRCTSVTPDCQLIIAVKWLGAKGQRYQMFCPVEEMGIGTKDLPACVAKAHQFILVGWEIPAVEGGAGIEVHRLSTASCLWVRKRAQLEQEYPGLLSDPGFFFSEKTAP